MFCHADELGAAIANPRIACSHHTGGRRRGGHNHVMAMAYGAQRHQRIAAWAAGGRHKSHPLSQIDGGLDSLIRRCVETSNILPLTF